MNNDKVYLRSCLKEEEMMDQAKKERGFLNFFEGKPETIIEVFKEHSEVITDTEECLVCFGCGTTINHEECNMCGGTGYIVYKDDMAEVIEWNDGERSG